LGVVGKSPRGIRAFKFPSKQATTKIKDIRVQIGRTGAITPVAILEPVKIDGATITRATLHNEDEIKRLGVKIGDTVIIERAGDVIPAVVKSLKELRNGKEKNFYFPRECPVCKTQLTRSEKEIIWRCPSPKIIKLLAIEGLVTQPADIFELKEGDLISLEGFAKKSAKNLIKEIQKTKNISLNRLIYALGIRHVGEETAIDLAERFRNMDNLKNANLEDLEMICDIGDVVAKSIYKWFKEKRNINFLMRLKKAGVNVLVSAKTKRKLFNKSFGITGTLETMSREIAQARIRELGGDTRSSLSKNTDFLVVGKNPGKKLNKAKKLGIKTITEKELLALL